MEEYSDARILIVDDMSSYLDLLEMHLGSEYKVTRAGSGTKVMKLMYDGLYPDLILLDIVMEGLDGYSVCKKLKADDKFKDIPVIFLSSLSNLDDKTKGFEYGAVDYITKPFEAAEVKARVRTHIMLKKSKELLKKQNKQLKEAMELKEDVNKIFQHDLKSPLTVVIGCADILTGECDDKGQLEMIEGIRRAGLQILKLINFSLDLFKIEHDMYTLSLQNLDVRVLLLSVVQQFKFNSIYKSVKISYDLCESDCMISAEEMLIYSLFLNLLQNAVEAALPDGGIYISLKKSDFCEITVRNNGEVPKEIQETFFNKFVTSGKRTGTGLGTYAVNLISKMHHGSVSLDTSEPGFTTVSVKIPLIK